MKFITKDMREAAKDNWPSSGDIEDWSRYEPREGLYACDETGKPIRLIAIDGGEPEDQSFRRDWDWVPREMNRLADKIREAEAKSEKAKAVLEVVEEAMERCAKCAENNNCENAFLEYFGARLIQTGCPLEPIRRAWKKGK